MKADYNRRRLVEQDPARRQAGVGPVVEVQFAAATSREDVVHPVQSDFDETVLARIVPIDRRHLRARDARGFFPNNFPIWRVFWRHQRAIPLRLRDAAPATMSLTFFTSSPERFPTITPPQHRPAGYEPRTR